jgi:D-beta-D-heptose 7-phosphate kinase/D-beta-D-heptose 1-phosphate adenosyltransferase
MDENQNNWAALEGVLASLKRVSVLVVGDLMLDEYLYGTIDRISPEAPVGVLDWRSRRSWLGGAANVAHNLVQLGCTTFLSGVVGSDRPAEELLQAAGDLGIDSAAIITDSGRPTTVKTRVIAHGHQVIRIDREARHAIGDSVSELLLDGFKHCLPRIDGVILSDYAKGVLRADFCASVMTAAARKGIPVLVDPKGHDFSKYRGAFLLTPNKKELAEATQMPVQSESDIRKAVERLLALVECKAILVTRGEEGMSLYRAGGEETHIQAEVRDVFDITGAGDTVISTFGRVFFAGADLLPAAQLANIAAGVKVGKLGTATVTAEEIVGWFRQRENQSKEKVVELSQLKQIVSLQHSQGKRVVFTNGCFDLLHVGHVHFLKKAKALGHLLIVAINDDASVKSIKGNGRPLINAADRARIIAALESVDYVVIFSGLTPLHMIEELMPDVLVKGGTYKLEEVVGRREVEKYGGRVELIPTIDNQSSSQIMKDIATRYRLASQPSK